MAPNPHHRPFLDPVPSYPRTRPRHGPLSAVDLRGSLTTVERAVRLLRTEGPDAQRLDNRNSIFSPARPSCLHYPTPAPVRCVHIGPLTRPHAGYWELDLLPSLFQLSTPAPS
jgi:hypothetical protein